MGNLRVGSSQGTILGEQLDPWPGKVLKLLLSPILKLQHPGFLRLEEDNAVLRS